MSAAARGHRRALDDGRRALARHPRHGVLGAFVLGLLAAGLPPGWAEGLTAAAAGAAAALLGGRAAVAAATVVAVLVGFAVAGARTTALERTALGPRIAVGTHVGPVTVLTPLKAGRLGGRTAIVALAGEPVLLRLPGPTPRVVPVGSVLRVDGRLSRPDRHARLLRAHAVLHASAARPTGRRRGGLAGALDRARDRAQHTLHGVRDPAARGLLRGMVLGDDSALPTGDRLALRAAGLAHLVAASGQNVLLLCTLVLVAGAALGLSWSTRLAVALVLVAAYVPLAGAGPSIQRAGIMGAAGLVAGLAGRPSSRWYALLLAAAVTLTLDPRAAADAGWRLSFCAVVGLMTLGARLEEAGVAARLPRPIAAALATTAAATLATAPLLAATFGTTSLVTVPANLAAAVLVMPIMWVGFVAAALGQVVPEAGRFTAEFATVPLHGILAVGHAAAGVPGATARIAPWLVTAACALAASAVVSPTVRRCSPAALLGLVALGLALAPRPAPVLAAPQGLRLAFIDVGQGDATLVQHGTQAVLVDAGPPDGPVVATLARLGVRRLDALVVTHAQSDHDGGAAAVLDAVPVGLVLDGRDGVRGATGTRMAAAARDRGVPLVLPEVGQVLRVGPAALHVRSPVREAAHLHAGADPNDRAVVLELAAGGFRALLAADAESPVLAGLPLEPVDVLKVAHHGSADEGLPGLLARLRPTVAVVSSGRGNRFGHPAPSTLAALRAAVPSVLRTDRDGTIVLDGAPGPIRVTRLR